MSLVGHNPSSRQQGMQLLSLPLRFEQRILPSAHIPAGNVTLFVYGSGDIVSDSLKGSAHGWESAEIQEWLWAIRQWKPPATPVNGSTATVGDRPRPLTVDIGANLDWFSLNAAAAGARVAAFEGERTRRGVSWIARC